MKVLNFTLESALLGTIEDWGQREPELFDHQIVSELHESDDDDDIEEDDVEYVLDFERIILPSCQGLDYTRRTKTIPSDSLIRFCCEPNFHL